MQDCNMDDLIEVEKAATGRGGFKWRSLLFKRSEGALFVEEIRSIYFGLWKSWKSEIQRLLINGL